MAALIRPGKERYIMRLNGKMIMEVMGTKNLTVEMVCNRMGLYPKSFQWILKEGAASGDAAERIADAVGLTLGEILLPEITDNVENVIEFIKDSDRAAVSFSQGRYKSRIKKLAAERPEEYGIVAENKDGSLCAHVPVAWIKISPPAARTEVQRETARKRMQEYHVEHGSTIALKG